MDFCFKKTFRMLIKNPQIVLLFVTYGIISMGLLPLLIVQQEKYVHFIIFGLLIVLSMAFFSGWFGCIKYVVCTKETDNVEEDIKNRHDSFVIGFFSAVTRYFLQMAFFFVLFVVFVQIVQYLIGIFFDSEALSSFVSLIMSQTPTANILSLLPKETINELVKINLFSFACFNLFFYLNIYVLPALFFNEKTTNPLCAVKEGYLALFKKPFDTLLLFILFSGANLVLLLLENILLINSALIFLFLVLRIYFIAYGVVLLFNVYEANFKETTSCDCDNGTYSLGENKTCD